MLGGAPMLTIEEMDAGTPQQTAIHCDNVSTSSPNSQKNACLNYCNDSLDAALDMLFYEPNTAVMVARQMIQRLVTSNPSPAYIQRVTQRF